MPNPQESAQSILNGAADNQYSLRVSSYSPDANNAHVSAVQGDAGLQLVSAKQGDGGLLRISAIQDGGAALNVSAKSGDGGTLRSSAIQGDASVQRVSASIFPDTTGALTIFRNLNLSSSVTAKATAGSIFGWHAWNSDTKPNYINIYNTSGAINVGTDTPLFTISLAASGRSDHMWDIGFNGFTAGIGLASVSVNQNNATTAGTASAVGINLLYK